jgi:hypothetical protein
MTKHLDSGTVVALQPGMNTKTSLRVHSSWTAYPVQRTPDGALTVEISGVTYEAVKAERRSYLLTDTRVNEPLLVPTQVALVNAIEKRVRAYEQEARALEQEIARELGIGDEATDERVSGGYRTQVDVRAVSPTRAAARVDLHLVKLTVEEAARVLAALRSRVNAIEALRHLVDRVGATPDTAEARTLLTALRSRGEV